MGLRLLKQHLLQTKLSKIDAEVVSGKNSAVNWRYCEEMIKIFTRDCLKYDLFIKNFDKDKFNVFFNDGYYLKIAKENKCGRDECINSNDLLKKFLKHFSMEDIPLNKDRLLGFIYLMSEEYDFSKILPDVKVMYGERNIMSHTNKLLTNSDNDSIVVATLETLIWTYVNSIN